MSRFYPLTCSRLYPLSSPTQCCVGGVVWLCFSLFLCGFFFVLFVKMEEHVRDVPTNQYRYVLIQQSSNYVYVYYRKPALVGFLSFFLSFFYQSFLISPLLPSPPSLFLPGFRHALPFFSLKKLYSSTRK